MTDKEEKVLELAKKLKALADGGVGGEKSNAIDMLKKYMAKHNISIVDIETDRKQEHIFTYKNNQKTLLRQIIFTVLGKDTQIYSYARSRKNVFIVECTQVQRINIEAMFDFYWAAFEREYEIFELAFINRNRLFPEDDVPRKLSELSPEEMAKANRMFLMANSMKKHEFVKMIE